jgi:hypothetical protein
MNRLKLLREEGGTALVAGIIILMVITLLGLAVLQWSDVQSHQTGVELSGERAFNLAESALNAEASLLPANWPLTPFQAYSVCNQSSTQSSTCPAGSVTAGFNTTYAGSGFAIPPSTWSVQVIDDNAGNNGYYSDSILSSSQLQHWDSNINNRLWIRADATVQGQHRIVVEQVIRQVHVLSLPQNVVTSAGLITSNNGNKIIIQATDPNSGLAGAVALRCTNASGQPSYGDPCAGWDPTHGQLSPANDYQMGYVDPGGNYQTLSGGTLGLLRLTALENGTYYGPGQCPPLGQSGILFVEDANCSYSGTGNTNWNSDSAPGAIVVASGTLTFNANVNFYGIIYMANGQGKVPSSGPCTPQTPENLVFTVQGGGSLHGGLFVDKCGTVNAGDKAFDIVYDANAFSGFKTISNPAPALNTFRILPNS